MVAAPAPSFRHQPPALQPHLVRRPRLLATLRGRFDRRLTVVAAGAGYGKTTVLSQALDENRSDPYGDDVWLLAGGRDRTPSHLLAALGEALSGTGDQTPTVEHLHDLIVLRSPASVCLVIDDAHLLDGSDAWDAIRDLLDALPANGHLMIGSRTLPPLSVRRRQSTGEAAVLTEADLAFSDSELGELVQRLRPDPDLRGGGRAGAVASWPAVAVLSATAGHEASLGYLWEEILGGLPADQRRALALVARIGLVDDELVGAVVGGDWTASSLVAGLPLVDSVGSSSRLHDLWLQALADVVPPTQWRPALAAGAEVLLARGELVRAVRLFRDAGDLVRLRLVVRRFASLPLSAGLNRPEAEALLDVLPEPDREGSLGLSLRAVLQWTAGEVERALEQMLDQARSEGDDELRALAWWRMTQLRGDTDPTSMALTPEVEELASAGWPLARSAVALIRSHQAQDRGDVAEALAVLEGLGGIDPQTRQVALASRLLALGRPEAVEVSLEDVLAAGVADPVAAQAVWLRGDIDPLVAWPVAATLPAAYGLRRLPAVEVPLLAVVSSVAMAAGATAEARSLADQALGRAHLVVPRLQLFALVADAFVALHEEGDEAFVVRLRRAQEVVPFEAWPAWAYLGVLGPVRALDPEGSRLDGLDLGGALSTAVAAGRAIAELRAGRGPAAAEALPWRNPTVLLVHLGPALLCELAVAAGRAAGPASGVLASLPGASRWLRRLLGHPDASVRSRAQELVSSLPERPDHDLHVQAFGGLAVTRSDGVAVPSLDRRGRLRQLLARLVVERSIPRDSLAEEMWPELSPDQAANNLRVNLSKLLDVIEPDRRGSGSWWIQAHGERLVLATEGLTTDVEVFDRHLADARAAEAQGAPTVAYDHYRAASALYEGELLHGLDDGAVLHERIRLASLAYGAACRQAEFQLARGEPEVALGHATEAAGLDPYGERAHRLLVRCHLALGSNSSARATAQLLRDRLAAEGLRPEPETEAELARLRV